MKIAPIIALFVVPFAVSAVTVYYDPIYDDGSQLLSETPCHNIFGSMNMVYFGDVPTFPYIAASAFVQGEDSLNCGSCFEIQYGGTTIEVTIVDQSDAGWVLSETAMNMLTNNQAEVLGTIDATAVQIERSICRA